MQTQEDNSNSREIQKRGTNPQEGGLGSQSELKQNFTTAKGLHLIQGAPMPCSSFAFLLSLSITLWLERAEHQCYEKVAMQNIKTCK